MKKKAILACLLMVSVTTTLASDREKRKPHSLQPGFSIGENSKLSFRNESVFITHRHCDDDVVEITSDGILYVNERIVRTDDDQQERIREYYQLAEAVFHDAIRIGAEGAHVGLHGAKLGIQATAGVFRLLLPDYDSEDFERDMEREKSKLETKAKELEEKADQIERDVDCLESLHQELKKSIPELEGLDWF